MNRGVYSRTVVDAAEDGRPAWLCRWLSTSIYADVCCVYYLQVLLPVEIIGETY